MSLAVSTLEAITGEDTEEDDEVPEVLTTKEAVCVPILPPSDKECAVCRSTDLSKKYKCPKCFAKYCSMPCCHRICPLLYTGVLSREYGTELTTHSKSVAGADDILDLGVASVLR